MPSASVCEIAGSPSTVAGILIITFGRSTASYSFLAISAVWAVSLARRGSTSIDTRPSTPFVRS
jgi:hypothetical protein